ncbi:hypothetical protein B0A52_07041 [Exophiala mesophila]|uniref:tRNA (guanine(26)-N(2))-dimethyltransferase n=1 Tax=Exophiala mesophila TaxID=212818 RepID=A0A438MZI6_EXOME|nr:hypothetical protein B0A52_07041 [Exophiala mesophila]
MTSNGTSQIVVLNGTKFRAVREGLASILAPYGADTEHRPPAGNQVKNNDEGNQAVFYNPIQQFNRDLSVLAITVHGEGAVIEKSARISKRSSKSKDKRKQNVLSKSLKDSTAVSVQDTANKLKRKAEQSETPNEDALPNSPAKRPRTTNEFQDEDDLPVVQLDENPQDENAEIVQTAPVSAPALHDAPSAALDVSEPTSEPPQQPTPKQTQFTILDALSATGLRALRYAQEIPFATKVVANDLSPEAVKAINLNVEHNGLKGKIHANLGDARAFMYSKVGNEHSKASEGYVHRFDVIDLDPYGTAAPFFDSSLQALQDGGLLCVTCTDAAIFASTGYPEKTYAMYGGIPVKGPHAHEGGLRLIINAVALAAAKYGLAIEPLLSLYIDYYARLFIRVHKKPNEVKLLPGSTMIVYGCGHGCGSWTTQPLLRNQSQTAKNGEVFYKYIFAQAPTSAPSCEHCGFKTHLVGPMWAGPIHNSHFVQQMLDKVPSMDTAVYGTTDRMKGMLTLALEEDLSTTPSTVPAKAHGPVDPKIIPRLSPSAIDASPFFVMPTLLAKILHCTTPSEEMMRSAILSLGYRVSRSHCKAGSIKTNAPFTVLWEIIREFMRTKHPIKEGAVKKGTPGWNILARLRGTEGSIVTKLKEDGLSQIRRSENRQDLRAALQSMLWKLDHEKAEGADSNQDDPQVNGNGDNTEKPKENPESPGPASTETFDPSKLKIVFDEELGKDKQRSKLVRYQTNPRENWGPMNRAGRTT